MELSHIIYLYRHKMTIGGIFPSLPHFTGVFKKSFFAIFHDFLKNQEGNFFEKGSPEIDVEYQIYLIRSNILFSPPPSIVDFSGTLKKVICMKSWRFFEGFSKSTTGFRMPLIFAKWTFPLRNALKVFLLGQNGFSKNFESKNNFNPWLLDPEVIRYNKTKKRTSDFGKIRSDDWPWVENPSWNFVHLLQRTVQLWDLEVEHFLRVHLDLKRNTLRRFPGVAIE